MLTKERFYLSVGFAVVLLVVFIGWGLYVKLPSLLFALLIGAWCLLIGGITIIKS